MNSQKNRFAHSYNKIVALFLMVSALVLAGCSSDPTPTPTPQPESKTIVDIAVEDGRFETLVAAVTAAGLVDTLSGDGPFTVFAPTDEAFAALPAGTVEALLADIPALTEILTYHVVSGAVSSSVVVGLESAETIAGPDVTIRVDGGNVLINDAQVIIADIQASNGIIHVIDKVLIP
jgi:transforming growth factor-beta-induced protein